MIEFPNIEWWRNRLEIAAGTGKYETSISGVSATFDILTTRELLRAKNFTGEQELIEQMLERTHSSDIFWDVGANIGTHSCFIGQVARETHAFEPDDRTADRLTRNLDLNEIIGEIHQIALFDSDTQVGFDSTTSIADPLGSGLMGINEASDDLVTAVQGDNYMSEHNLPAPDIIKIDVEGFEKEVIIGAESAVSNARDVFIEVHNEDQIQDIRGILRPIGFNCTIHKIRDDEIHLHASKTENE